MTVLSSANQSEHRFMNGTVCVAKVMSPASGGELGLSSCVSAKSHSEMLYIMSPECKSHNNVKLWHTKDSKRLSFVQLSILSQRYDCKFSLSQSISE